MLSFVIQIIIYFHMLVIFCTVLPWVSEFSELEWSTGLLEWTIYGLDYQCPTYLQHIAQSLRLWLMVGNLVWPDRFQVSLWVH